LIIGELAFYAKHTTHSFSRDGSLLSSHSKKERGSDVVELHDMLDSAAVGITNVDDSVPQRDGASISENMELFDEWEEPIDTSQNDVETVSCRQ